MPIPNFVFWGLVLNGIRRPVLMAHDVELLRLRDFRHPEPAAGVSPLALTAVERLDRD